MKLLALDCRLRYWGFSMFGGPGLGVGATSKQEGRWTPALEWERQESNEQGLLLGKMTGRNP